MRSLPAHQHGSPHFATVTVTMKSGQYELMGRGGMGTYISVVITYLTGIREET